MIRRSTTHDLLQHARPPSPLVTDDEGMATTPFWGGDGVHNELDLYSTCTQQARVSDGV